MDFKVMLDTVWVVFAGVLVFFMNLGFAAVETGLARQKNSVNILSKNFIVFAVSSLGFLVLGWGLMFGDGNGFMGLKGLFMASGADNSPAPPGMHMGRVLGNFLDRYSVLGKVLLPAGVLRNRGDHSLRCRCRTH
jgi:Amt family ammonium transporter